jgi:predicted ribosomally synthesized peptide with SipW-like signal peptide
MRLSKVAILLATAGMSLALIGAGLSAAFTDSGTVTQDVEIGSFGIALSTTSGGCVVNDAHSITCTAPQITSSAPGSAPIAFTMTATGDIPANVDVTTTWNPPQTGPWSSLPLTPPGPYSVALGAPVTVSAGLQWGELGPSELGDVVSVTYALAASDV